MKQILRKVTAIVLVAVLAALGASCKNTVLQARQQFAAIAMGSDLTVTFYEDLENAPSLSDEMFRAVFALDREISANESSSLLCRLNRGEEAVFGADTLALVSEALGVCERSGGALDITVGAVSSLWGFGTDSPRLPADEEIKAALASVDYRGVRVDEENRTVSLPEGAMLDLGAVGKGAAMDAMAKVLDRQEAVSCIVSFGGSVMIYGGANGKTYTVGVRDPRQPDTLLGTLVFTPEKGETVVISTSGSYEKKIEVDGKTYHHILDPETGYPVEGELLSVTVVCENGALSDALSTAAFVMGYSAESLALLESYSANALFVCADGTVRVTPGLSDAFELTGTEYATDPAVPAP